MAHHTRFVKGWLPIQYEDITIKKMSVNLLVDSCGTGMKAKPRGSMIAFLGCQQLIRDCCSLLDGELVLQYVCMSPVRFAEKSGEFSRGTADGHPHIRP